MGVRRQILWVLLPSGHRAGPRPRPPEALIRGALSRFRAVATRI